MPNIELRSITGQLEDSSLSLVLPLLGVVVTPLTPRSGLCLSTGPQPLQPPTLTPIPPNLGNIPKKWLHSLAICLPLLHNPPLNPTDSRMIFFFHNSYWLVIKIKVQSTLVFNTKRIYHSCVNFKRSEVETRQLLGNILKFDPRTQHSLPHL
jgi:hypothetical protein